MQGAGPSRIPDAGQLLWQQQMQPGGNNNSNHLPCGAHQCPTGHQSDSREMQVNSVQSYASYHGLQQEDLAGYKPELTPNENPHYYQINSVLYLAHLEKASRQGFELKQ